MAQQVGIVPDDEVVERNRGLRLFVCVITLAVCFTAPAFVMNLLVWFLFSNAIFAMVAFLIGLSVGTRAVTAVFPYVTKHVPAWQGLVTLDLVNKEMVVYGPGLHPSFPWEKTSSTSHQSLRVMYKQHTETYPTKDDLLSVRYSFQFQADLERLEKYAGVNEGDIDKGFSGLFSGDLSSRLTNFSAKAAKKNQKKIAGEISDAFGIGTTGAGSKTNEKQLLEDTYGGNLLNFTIEDADFSADLQKARTALSKAELRFSTIAKLQEMTKAELKRRMKLPKGDPEHVSREMYQQMFDNSIIADEIGKKNINVNIHEVKGDAAKAVTVALANLMKGGN